MRCDATDNCIFFTTSPTVERQDLEHPGHLQLRKAPQWLQGCSGQDSKGHKGQAWGQTTKVQIPVLLLPGQGPGKPSRLSGPRLQHQEMAPL